MTKIEKLEKEMERLRKASAMASMPFDKKIREIDELLWAEKIKLAEKNVGKCYVYVNNCYSCPKSSADYWDTFYKITSIHKAVDEHDYDYYCILQVEKDKNGEIKIEQFHDGIACHMFNEQCYKEIKPAEFDKKLNQFLEEIIEVAK